VLWTSGDDGVDYPILEESHTMTKWLGFALLACGAVSAAAALAPQNEGLVWFEDYQEALRQAKQSHKPLFVEFRCEP
jgi:hypothetical protein